MIAAVYLRQSIDATGEGLAVARQREDCLALCADRGWTPVEYVDNDTSASKGTRPAYTRMLGDVRAGKVGALVAWNLDRLYRQPRELEDLIDLADEHHLALATIGGETNLATDDGRLFARVKGAVARAEVDRKAARQKRSNDQRADRGMPSRSPAGGSVSSPTGSPTDPKRPASSPRSTPTSWRASRRGLWPPTSTLAAYAPPAVACGRNPTCGCCSCVVQRRTPPTPGRDRAQGHLGSDRARGDLPGRGRPRDRPVPSPFRPHTHAPADRDREVRRLREGCARDVGQGLEVVRLPDHHVSAEPCRSKH